MSNGLDRINDWQTQESFEHFRVPAPVLAMLLPKEQFDTYARLAAQLNEGRAQHGQNNAEVDALKAAHPEASMDGTDEASQKLRAMVQNFGRQEHDVIFKNGETVREMMPAFEERLQAHCSTIQENGASYWANFWQTQYHVSRERAHEVLNSHEPGLADSIENTHSMLLESAAKAIQLENLENDPAMAASFMEIKMERIKAAQFARDIGRSAATALSDAYQVFNPSSQGQEFRGAPMEPTGNAISNAASPLILAAHQGNVEKLESLLRDGADVNARGANGETPYMVANGSMQQEAALFLREAGADVNARDNDGLTASDHLQEGLKNAQNIAELARQQHLAADATL